ncbi:MAG TPA: exo-alpha-sialidase [Clostridiaceae bacterium]|nr:exo-alpha-sialidase [Clostridiaceae bacterium]
MRVISKGSIAKPPDDKNFNSNTFPCIVKLPSGRWLAAFKASEKKGDCDFMHAVMTWSDDEGKTWARPFEPVKLPHINGVPGQSRIMYFLPLGGRDVLMVANWVDTSDLSKPYYNPINESLKDTRIFFCFSKDDGETWSAPELMDTDSIIAPTPLTGAPFMLKDGTIVCQFEVNKHEWDTSKWVHKSAMIFSRDGGKTWGDVSIVTEEPDMYYWDQRPNVLKDGMTILNFFWTLDGKKQQYLNIHARESLDGGKTWGELWDTGIYGQPGQPVDLGDGRIATIEIDRSIRPVITVRTSRDHGRNYEESLVIYDSCFDKQDSKNISMNDAWDEMARFSVGHPNLLNLGQRELLAYYYAGNHCDNTRIEFVRISV